MSNDFNELETLLLDWEVGEIERAGIERLRELLKNDPAARERYVELQMLAAAMQLETDAGLAIDDIESGVEHAAIRQHSSSRPQPSATPSFWLASALSVLVCVLAGLLAVSWLAGNDSQPPPLASNDPANGRNASEEATAHGVALITRLVDVAWNDEQPIYELGDALPRGRFGIKSGHAQIEFFCGATVIVEGPAELDLQSPMLARVRSGQLRAHVPPAARGFTLEVDDMQVVDLGTEFALSISDEGANVQVFDGEVELHRPATETRLLSAGESVLRTAGGSYREAQLTPQRFVDLAGIESRAQRQRSHRYQRWQAWSAEIRRDPRLIAYYAFDHEGDWQRRLPCDIEPDNGNLDGAIVGAREVSGRWGTKRALEFKQPADRVRVNVPGEFGSLTFACWAKIDSLDRWYNSLFLTDDYNQGEPHWQILDTGQLYFSVRPTERGEEGPTDFKVLSEPFWKPSMSGRWIHLAATYNADSGHAAHYVNGEAIHEVTIPAAKRVATTRIGAASIGNWSLPTQADEAFAIRNLNGSIDEFIIFSAALSATEIKDMVDHGKP